jgi:hypothetical protein
MPEAFSQSTKPAKILKKGIVVWTICFKNSWR